MGIVLVPSVPGRLHFEPGPDKLLSTQILTDQAKQYRSALETYDAVDEL